MWRVGVALVVAVCCTRVGGGVPTNPPVPTPVPGWTMSPGTFPPPTPLPPGPPVTTPIPSGGCPMCTALQCTQLPVDSCSSGAPFLCLTGAVSGSCMSTPWTTDVCTSCCDYASCLPTAPPLFPPTPWDLVPPSPNCTNTNPLYLAPDAGATPYGGLDVSELGCRAGVSQDCCGVTPRFNWALAMCSPNPEARVSMACNHTFGNTSTAEIYYIAAYQWNLDLSGWVMDPTSSFFAPQQGGVLNFSTLNLTLLDHGEHQDWDLKYGPTTAGQGTNGLGPPAMLFVISARALQWITFYVLNQIISNRGPGGERYFDNCWSSSAGEFDFLEPPFWAGVDLPGDRLYTTITSGTGRCLPVQKAVSKRFQRECNHEQCCQACSCPPGTVCFGISSYQGFEPMGCTSPNGTIPNGMEAFTLDGSSTACGAYFGAVPGGSQSTSYFSRSMSPEATTEVMYAAVVDGDGVTVFRWAAADPTAAAQVWPGLQKYAAASTLQPNPAVAIPPGPPCEDFTAPCALHVPSCDDDCAIYSASGSFGLTELAGTYAAECARDGLNWWNAFVSTNQTPGMMSHQLPLFVNVSAQPVPLPFSCNVSCGGQCHSPSRCGPTAPYQCLSGDALGMCSDINVYWPLSAECTSCCDVALCGAPCAATCTPQQCAVMDCNVIRQPYYCAAGPMQGACSASPTFFPQQEGCYTCCDAASCG